MSLKRIANNNDLATYLLQLSTELGSRGRAEHARLAQFAGAFASGSTSEFLYEAERALEEVERSCSDVLSELELAQIVRVLKQIREAFDRVGGA